MKTTLQSLLAIGVAVFCAAALQAATITHTVYPGDVPDESEPRANLGDAPSGYGPNSWQGPATGKSNYHVRYLADGDALSILFPTDAATLSVSDIASISYITNRPNGTPAARDWWIQLYTRPDGVDDDASWYGYRFLNNFEDHTATDAWTQYSTSDNDWAFRRNSGAGGPEQSFADFQAAYGSELVEMISVQTDSGWNGFDGYIDGLEIALTNGNVGRVNFEAVPEPASLVLLCGAVAGLGFSMRRRRR